MPLCSEDQRQNAGAALGKMRDRMYNNVHGNFKREQMRLDKERQEDSANAPIFTRLRRMNIYPSYPKPLASTSIMSRPPPIRKLQEPPSSGYGKTFANRDKAASTASTCNLFMNDYSPMPSTNKERAKAHLCSNARAWADPFRLMANRTVAQDICAASLDSAGRPKTRQAVGTRTENKPSAAIHRPATRASTRSDDKELGSQGQPRATARTSMAEGREKAEELIKYKGWGYYSKLTHLKDLPQNNAQCKQFMQHFLADKGKTIFPKQGKWVDKQAARDELQSIIQRNTPVTKVTR